jgi:phosphatidylinositol alpha 1,6-mannosyltransferase
MNPPRVALFACAYNEVDGVANTIRHFEEYAATRNLPLLLVNGGPQDRDIQTGSVRRFEFRRRFPKFALDKKHDFDLFFWRYLTQIESVVRHFRADILHITGPSEVGMLGALVAHRLRIPLVASWHTNVHEYAERRATPLLFFVPQALRKRLGNKIRQLSFRAVARYYRIPRMLFAPNSELIELLQRATGKECHLMSRGVDVNLFSPDRRTRQSGPFTLGYVGRITVEKNVEMLVRLEHELLKAGARDFRFLIVGQGASEPWLRDNLKKAEFAGVHVGERLAEAYANMDLFVFPSRTDTFGNVVLEALSCGVPALVTDAGGPKFIVKNGETGFVASDERGFAQAIITMMSNPEQQRSMARASRAYALGQSWEVVFDHIYSKYHRLLSVNSLAQENMRGIGTNFSAAGAAL